MSATTLEVVPDTRSSFVRSPRMKSGPIGAKVDAFFVKISSERLLELIQAKVNSASGATALMWGKNADAARGSTAIVAGIWRLYRG